MTDNVKLEKAAHLLSDYISRKPERLKEKRDALREYGEHFASGNLDQLTPEIVKNFLQFPHNKHWTGLFHFAIYADMNRLKKVLRVLLDEEQPIEVRLDQVTDENGSLYIKGLKRAVLTAILMCVHPDKYAVYNSKSASGLTWLGLNRARKTDSLGQQYVEINKACREVKERLNRDLELVDLMFGLMAGDKSLDETPPNVARRNPDWTFTPEFEGTKKAYRPKGTIESFCDHGTVVGALHNELKALGRESFNTGKIDLFLADEQGRITHLLEIKTDQTTTSLYQALGQVMLHGALEHSSPLRILVLPGRVSADTASRLARLNTRVLTYEWNGSTPVFIDLGRVL